MRGPGRETYTSVIQQNIDEKDEPMFPKGLGGLGDLAGMMRQAMEMKGKIEQIKNELAELEYQGEAGGGMVKVLINGKFEMLSLSLDPEIIDKNDPSVMETMIRAATNEAVLKAHESVKEKMTEMTGGFDIPGLTS